MWLVSERVAREMQSRIEAGFVPSDEAQSEFMAAQQTAAQDGRSRSLKIRGGVAQIQVEGLLTPKPDLWAVFFGMGNTSYEDIRSDLALAENDPEVREIQFDINSPGGTVAGLFDALAAIDAAKKPTTVRTSFAASAAYSIAAVAGKITATNAAVEIGSIGVAQSFYVSDNRIDVTSTEAPNKRPDVRTEAGRAVVRAELDAIHELFAEAIALGRRTTVADVNETYGRGSTFVAVEAKRRGMIDDIEQAALRAVPKQNSAAADEPAENQSADASADATPEKPAAGGETVRTRPMDIIKLQSEHPELYASIVEKATETERDRVEAHLEAGLESGDMDTAVASIRSGAEMTQKLASRYMMAGIKKHAQATRQEETDEAGEAVDGGAEANEDKDLGDKICDVLDAQAAETTA